MRRFAFVAGVLALVLLAPLFAPGQTSRHCPAGKGYAEFPPGEYAGDFSLYAFAEKQDFREMVTLKGKLTLRVSSDGLLWTGSTADATFDIYGTGVSKDIATAAITNMSGAFVQTSPRRDFTLTGSLNGKFQVIAPNGQPVFRSPVFSGVQINFVTTNVWCQAASGSFTAPFVEETMKGFESKGFQISPGSGNWRVGPMGRGLKEMNSLRQELYAPAPAGETRELLGKRLGGIADRIKAGPEQLRDCLSRIWMDYVRGVIQRWVQEDIAKLKAYSGDLAGYEPVVKTSLADDRSLCLIGLDDCSSDLHDQLFNAIEDGYSRQLKQMARDLAPPADILRALKAAELMGDISPGLRTRVINALIKEAWGIVQQYVSDLKTYLQLHANMRCGSDLQWLEKRLMNAAREYETLAGDGKAQAAAQKAMGDAGRACFSSAAKAG